LDVRYPPGHRKETRARILGAAADLFRRDGIAATSVDAVMAAAGLTAGGFYAHFRSKDALVTEAVNTAAERARERWYGRVDHLSGRAWARALIHLYLSEPHRDDRAQGCILPSLSADVARSTRPTRRHFEARLRGLIEQFSARIDGALPAERAEVIGAVALAVGGVVLSRAVLDRELSTEILAASRSSAERLLGSKPRLVLGQPRLRAKQKPKKKKP
jgi:TetR/AcrR family transcriptional repressor of nem operon